MGPKVLVVLTSQKEIPSLKKPTGWYLVSTMCLSATSYILIPPPNPFLPFNIENSKSQTTTPYTKTQLK